MVIWVVAHEDVILSDIRRTGKDYVNNNEERIYSVPEDLEIDMNFNRTEISEIIIILEILKEIKQNSLEGYL